MSNNQKIDVLFFALGLGLGLLIAFCNTKEKPYVIGGWEDRPYYT